MFLRDPFKLFHEKIEAHMWEIRELESLSKLAEGDPAFMHIESDLITARNRLDELLREIRFLLH